MQKEKRCETILHWCNKDASRRIIEVSYTNTLKTHYWYGCRRWKTEKKGHKNWYTGFLWDPEAQEAEKPINWKTGKHVFWGKLEAQETEKLINWKSFFFFKLAQETEKMEKLKILQVHTISNVPASLDKCHGDKEKKQQQFSTGLGDQKVGKPKKARENKKRTIRM